MSDRGPRFTEHDVLALSDKLHQLHLGLTAGERAALAQLLRQALTATGPADEVQGYLGGATPPTVARLDYGPFAWAQYLVAEPLHRHSSYLLPTAPGPAAPHPPR